MRLNVFPGPCVGKAYIRTCKEPLSAKACGRFRRHDGTVLMGLKNFILSKLEWQIDDGFAGERIYISRANQRARKIQNELEVQELLKAYGFSVVFFENMPFQEQIAVMGKAKYVVSSHGANLTNILFMPENTKVLEINKNNSPNLCYYSLAASINLVYFYQFCPPVREDLDIDNNADLRVDIEKLRENSRSNATMKTIWES